MKGVIVNRKLARSTPYTNIYMAITRVSDPIARKRAA
jgi:hypothetical protein